MNLCEFSVGDKGMNRRLYGTICGENIHSYTIKNANLSMSVINYGAIITDLTFDDNGKKIDLVLKHNSLEEYANTKVYYGSIVGRFANRIEKGLFILNGAQYQLAQNEGETTLHGGIEGFNRKVWKVLEHTENSITLFYQSVDGEQGFPGTLDVTVKYTLTDDNQVVIDYFATTDKDTIVSLTNHSYFNVNGIENTTAGILLYINADKITPADEKLIVHGDFLKVDGTLFDFRNETTFIRDLSSDNTLGARCCYDENFALNGTGYRKVAHTISPITKLKMEVYTDQAGMQIYTGNPHGIALETQNYPNCINCENYPSPILRQGEEYKSRTAYKFRLEK